MCSYVHTPTRMHPSTRAHMCTHLHGCTHPHVLTRAHTYTDASIHTCSHLHRGTHPHALKHAHTYTDAPIHTCSHLLTPTLRFTYQVLCTHMNAPTRAHTPCVETCTPHVCMHTHPALARTKGWPGTVCRRQRWSLQPVVPRTCRVSGWRAGEPQDSSGSAALALEPSTCSHAFAIVRRCEGPPDAWPASLPQQGPRSHFPTCGHPRFCSSSHSSRHGPTSPVSFMVVTLCSRNTGLLCGKQTRQQLTGRGRRWGQFGLRGPV